MKKVLIVLLAIGLVLAFTGCANTSTPSTSEPTPTPSEPSGGDSTSNTSTNSEEVTLRLAWWGGQTRHDVTLEVIKLYQDQNPHVTIETEFSSWDEYWQKLATQAAGNQLPDIIQMDLSYISQYATRGQLEDLNPYIESGLFDTSSISESALSGGMLDGMLYGMNLGVNALGTAYNPEILEQTGLSMPGYDWTWDDLEQLAKQMSEKGYYLTGPPNNEEFFAYYLRTIDQTLFSPDGTELGYTDDQHFMDYFSKIQRMYDAGAILSLDKASQIKTWEEGVVAKGEAVAEFLWSNQFTGFTRATEKNLEIHPLPGPGIEKGLFLKPSMYFSVTKNSQHKEEAAKFINFFVNDVEANIIMKGDRGAPISSVVQEALIPISTPEQVKMFEYISWADKNSSPISPPPPVGATEVYAILKELVEQSLYKATTLEKAAETFRVEANKILAKNKQ